MRISMTISARLFGLLSVCSIALICAFESEAKFTNKKQVQSDALKLAIANRKSGDYLQAVNILSKLRESYADHKRINIELTLNFIKLKQFDRAEQLVVHLQSLRLSDSEQKIVERLKYAIEKQTQLKISPHSFHMTSITSAGIDIVSNNYPVYVFEETESDFDFWADDGEFFEDVYSEDYSVIEYSVTDDFAEREEVTERNEVKYASQSLQANYRYRPSETINLFNRNTHWLLDAEGELSYKYLDKEDNNSFNSLRA